MRKKIKPTRFARRAGTLVMGLPDLQALFDILKEGGGLTMHIQDGPLPVSEIILVADNRLNEIMQEVGAEEMAQGSGTNYRVH